MKRLLQAALLALVGAGLLHASLLTDTYLRYVKEGMRPLLVVSGVILVVLALAEVWATHRNTGSEGHVPRVAWLLFLPALSLLLFAPPALGAYTAARETPQPVATADDAGFDPLPATTPLPITLGDFTKRVQQDRTKAISQRQVTMSGFVTPTSDGHWYLTRLLVSCCAADATALKIKVYGADAPKADTWVSVTGAWHPQGTLGTPSAEAALDARTVRRTDRPSNAYMDALPLG